MAEYYGVTLDAGMELTHTVAKKNFKFLKGCPFRYANSNPELIKTGKIIYVSDSHGIILPYICPNKIGILKWHQTINTIFSALLN